MCLAIPGKIESIEPAEGMFIRGKVSFGGIGKFVELSLVPEAKPGDYVLVHVGVAISVIDEEAARQTLDYVREIQETGEEFCST